ncbi:MAG: glutaminyl-peptide cyclotransferase [Bacteroidota bacterium]
MHFGPHKKSFLSLWRNITCLVCLIVLLAACNDERTIINFSSPSQGDNINLGDNIKLKLDLTANVKLDSVAYFVDGKMIAKSTSTDFVLLKTADLPLGYRMVTAIVTQGDAKDTINTNIVLTTKRTPTKLKYKVVQTFPHDTSAYTQGLSYVDGKLLESTGENGSSQVRYVDIRSGNVLQKTDLDAQYFGEGSVKIGNKIIMLTWRENLGFVFDAKTFKQIGTFPYQQSREGWGLSFDGKNILRSDGTNRIWLMNANNYQEEGYIEVYNQNGTVESLNELEYINGKIYANVYLTNKIVIINPKNGEVEAEIDLTELVPKNFFKTSNDAQNNVLNGIAWDANGKRLFVTGKKWPKLYQIEIVQ